MKIAIISDIHANLAALEALPTAGIDQIWCLGDLVNYGPQPNAVIRWIGENAAAVVRGNHDHAVGYNVDPQCSRAFSLIAAHTMDYTISAVTDKDRDFLRRLPVQREIEHGGERFYCVHAIPSDPLFAYCGETSDQWRQEADRITADVLLVGHTHTPFIRRLGRTLIVNPGSLGQPKTGRSLACYALYEDGKFALKEYEYPIDRTISAIQKMPIPLEDRQALISVLRTGTHPFRNLSDKTAADQNRFLPLEDESDERET